MGEKWINGRRERVGSKTKGQICRKGLLSEDQGKRLKTRLRIMTSCQSGVF